MDVFCAIYNNFLSVFSHRWEGVEKGIKLLRNIQILRFYMETDKNLRSPYQLEDKQLNFLKYIRKYTEVKHTPNKRMMIKNVKIVTFQRRKDHLGFSFYL